MIRVTFAFCNVSKLKPCILYICVFSDVIFYLFSPNTPGSSCVLSNSQLSPLHLAKTRYPYVFYLTEICGWEKRGHESQLLYFQEPFFLQHVYFLVPQINFLFVFNLISKMPKFWISVWRVNWTSWASCYAETQCSLKFLLGSHISAKVHFLLFIEINLLSSFMNL